jgi:hypothetical protein
VLLNGREEQLKNFFVRITNMQNNYMYNYVFVIVFIYVYIYYLFVCLDQGDLEREAGLCPPPFMDRYKLWPEKNTLNFIDFVARPLFISLQEFLPNTSVYVNAIDQNREK